MLILSYHKSSRFLTKKGVIIEASLYNFRLELKIEHQYQIKPNAIKHTRKILIRQILKRLQMMQNQS